MRVQAAGIGGAVVRGAGVAEAPQEVEPDYRFTLANERTFLAWVRTSLGLLAGAVAVVQFAPDVGPSWTREVLAVLLALLGATTAFGGLHRWLTAQQAMRRGEPLARGLLPFVVALSLVAAALITLVVLLGEAR